MTEEKAGIRETIEATDSVVHQTWEDLQDIGEIADITKATTELTASKLNILIRRHNNLESMIKRTIAEETEKQIKPLKESLDKMLLKDPKVIYIKLKLPNPFSWFLKLKWGKREVK